VVTPGKHSAWGDDASLAGGIERFQPDPQQAVGGITLDGDVRTDLLGQRLAQHRKKQAEGRKVEFAQFGQPDRTAGGQTAARRVDLLRFLSQLPGQGGAGLIPVPHGGQLATWRGLAIFPQPGINLEGGRVSYAGKWVMTA